MVQDPDFATSLRALYGTPLPRHTVAPLLADASTRRYYRVTLDEKATADAPSSAIIMQLPRDAFASDEGGQAINAERLPFLEVGDLLREAGIPVPEVYVEHLDRGQIVLEDLGPTTFERYLETCPATRWEFEYAQVVDLLVSIQQRCVDLPSRSIVARRRFDRGLLLWELDHFREWGLDAVFGASGSDEATVFEEASRRIVAEIEAMSFGFVHRDFQSRNLMIDSHRKMTVIDFQDALMGPRTYDLVALLCDSYVRLDPGLQESMIARYAAARRFSLDEVRREFWIVALHRKLKDAGRFVYIDRKRSKSSFLQWYPQSLAYVGRALGRLPGFEALTELLHQRIPGFPDAVEKPAATTE